MKNYKYKPEQNFIIIIPLTSDNHDWIYCMTSLYAFPVTTYDILPTIWYLESSIFF